MKKKRTIDLTRKIRLSYLESVQLFNGNLEPEEFFEVGADFSGLSNVKNPEGKTYNVNYILNSKFSYHPDPQNRRNRDSGWVLKGTTNEIDWSKVVYRIGLRELGLFSFNFSPVSEIVTKPIKSIKPIYKVEIEAEEVIPSDYAPDINWIEYHVSIDDGATWKQINPVDNNTRFDKSGAVIPRTLTIKDNLSVDDIKSFESKEDVFSVRIKYVLKSNDSRGLSSPVLKSSRVLLYPEQGLSGAIDGTV